MNGFAFILSGEGAGYYLRAVVTPNLTLTEDNGCIRIIDLMDTQDRRHLLDKGPARNAAPYLLIPP